MFKVKVNNSESFEITPGKEPGTGKINNEEFSLDAHKVSDGVYHLIKNNKGYNVQLIDLNKDTKEAVVRVNGNDYAVKVKDDMDLLLERLGMEGAANAAVKELKAPMPGLVIETRVATGDKVAKGEPLLVLEAMKMENVLKAPADVEIDQVVVSSGDAIEKNATLITFKS